MEDSNSEGPATRGPAHVPCLFDVASHRSTREDGTDGCSGGMLRLVVARV